MLRLLIVFVLDCAIDRIEARYKDAYHKLSHDVKIKEVDDEMES